MRKGNDKSAAGLVRKKTTKNEDRPETRINTILQAVISFKKVP